MRSARALQISTGDILHPCRTASGEDLLPGPSRQPHPVLTDGCLLPPAATLLQEEDSHLLPNRTAAQMQQRGLEAVRTQAHASDGGGGIAVASMRRMRFLGAFDSQRNAMKHAS